ncbi:ribonuclease III [Candidatus Similichlamydia epinepheli]|uniref:ribonuclease III n=1 Tax=Candidatus Similichlamydia epinepheli TaxID=1903953 RepID=UPI000D39F2CE|nr:ribonuclease III [Candidatus Similichlamydia epinepheli]
MSDTTAFWEEHAKQIEQQIGYSFRNSNLLKSAFTHCSYANEAETDCPTNERLEFLGDAVLNLVAANYLFIHYPDLAEGNLTKIRSNIVNDKSCHHYSKQLNLADHLLLGKGERASNKRSRIRIEADLFESLTGAIYLDGGLEKAREFLLKFICPAAEYAIRNPCENWKAQLQELCQKTKKGRPLYETLASSGPDHDRHYTCGAMLDGRLIGQGNGHSKKEAQQMAAQEAFSMLTGDIQKSEQTEDKLDM